MDLRGKRAIVHGAGGNLGGAVARSFARAGARVFLAGRSHGPLEKVAVAIRGEGGRAETAIVDALDERAVSGHVAAVVDAAGGVDIVFNAVGFDSRQGTAMTELAVDDFSFPLATWTRTQFLTSTAAARQMAKQGSGVVIMLSASPARLAVPLTGGFGVACAAIEALSRTLAAEVAASGVRVVCLRSHRVSGTLRNTPDFKQADPADFRKMLDDMTLLGRIPTIDEFAETATFLASDSAGAMTGAVLNMTCGMSVD